MVKSVFSNEIQFENEFYWNIVVSEIHELLLGPKFPDDFILKPIPRNKKAGHKSGLLING